MVTYHPPLNLLHRWPCTPHLHPAQLVAGARDTVAGGTRRGMRVALLHLGNGAASVPSSILGAFSRPVPPPSSDDRRKDVRARAADAGFGTARRRRKATYTEHADGCKGAVWGLETRSFQPTRPIVQGFLAFDDSEWCLQPHQGLCVAGQDRQTGCPPALRSQKAAAAASSCDNVAIYRII